MSALWSVLSTISAITTLVAPALGLAILTALVVRPPAPEMTNSLQKAGTWSFILLCLVGATRWYDGAGAGWATLAFMDAAICLTLAVAALLLLWRDEPADARGDEVDWADADATPEPIDLGTATIAGADGSTNHVVVPRPDVVTEHAE